MDGEEGRRAYLAALRMLGRRAMSVQEVVDRLGRRQFSDGAVREAVERLLGEGALDDSAYARAYIHDRLLLHPVGRRALRVELARRGVSPEIAEKALSGLDAAREEEVIREYLARHGYRPDCPGEERRRWRERLLRRGFCGEAIRRSLGWPVESAGAEAADAWPEP
ncbi:MAG TPA: hypothetical protein GXX28_04725 [Firmicutes bacterium]|nr:hypothetical protein [Bacillota bacterium]